MPEIELPIINVDQSRSKVSMHTQTLSGKIKSFYNETYKERSIGESREYWRDIILGVNDGLVSNFLLVAGVYGSKLNSESILLTATAGMIAGAISMAAGEYVATKTQEEVNKSETALEAKAVKERKKEQLIFLSDLLTKIGIPDADSPEDEAFNVRNVLLEYYENNDDAHVKINVALAFGDVEETERSPWTAGALSFLFFVIGSSTSVIPFAVTSNKDTAIFAAFIATMVLILLAGGIKTWATRGVWWVSAIENLSITAGGGGIAYGIGLAFDMYIHR
mmetsp:Transcript_3628/g.4642  ORF Transcript_3628/g.4642 Transcript_3628/m.4642 type:complete len:278 (-) Transcript_3628:55-888(-)